MRKILCLVFVFCLAQTAILKAADTSEIAPPTDSRRPQGTRESEQLYSENVADLKARVGELERRVNEMDRDRRFSEDRLRQLDRDVSELKRRF